ncbi:MAG: Rpn family recombination-promoting nuclease/putative transposase [Pelatocladus maniniholoensis HA4357-MV3]|jgi:predicted transposase/invertase (TIGR01784 family)|uniref:Rpn family recombination-promoting nuclease/putative transposase n=1 Tax=Pelatocladus maniniholoensis HA4357-MV3 TaxID=1117104 RepID=A0A9E3H8X9_9NOST|nr:Rpn family recombination-promoting nuclease/putative transposase [Pelatocladus maniniholoensis HA4357-MV3]
MQKLYFCSNGKSETDSLFYQLFAEFPSIFFELIGHSPSNSQDYQFRSVEIKQTAFRIDGVFLPPEDSPDKTVYLCEVQFQKDQFLYHRVFAELFLYLDQNPSTYDWYAVIIYPKRSLEPDQTRLHEVLLESSKVQRVYLDQLESSTNKSLGIGVVKLVVEPEENAANFARQLITQASQEIANRLSVRAIIDLIETIIVYKFPQLSRQEVEDMLKLSQLKQTRVYQEALEEGRQQGQEEGKLAAVPLLLKAGVSVEQIAQQLEVEIEAVRQIAQQQS